MTEPALYDQVGGTPFFERLVDRFYDGVRRDDVLRPRIPSRTTISPAPAGGSPCS